jgi:hypothetical protein
VSPLEELIKADPRFRHLSNPCRHQTQSIDRHKFAPEPCKAQFRLHGNTTQSSGREQQKTFQFGAGLRQHRLPKANNCFFVSFFLNGTA